MNLNAVSKLCNTGSVNRFNEKGWVDYVKRFSVAKCKVLYRRNEHCKALINFDPVCRASVQIVNLWRAFQRFSKKRGYKRANTAPPPPSLFSGLIYFFSFSETLKRAPFWGQNQLTLPLFCPVLLKFINEFRCTFWRYSAQTFETLQRLT